MNIQGLVKAAIIFGKTARTADGHWKYTLPQQMYKLYLLKHTHANRQNST